MEQLLIKDLPAGFTKVDDVKADSGPSDLEKAVHDEGGSDQVRRALIADGFIVGFQRGWQSADGRVILDFVYSFKTEAGARDHTDAVVKLVSDHPKSSPRPFSVAGIPGAVGVVTAEKSTTTYAVNFAVKTYGVQIAVMAPNGGEELATQFAQDQYTLLNKT